MPRKRLGRLADVQKLTPSGKVQSESAGEWKETFLNIMRAMPVIRVACQQAGISRQTAYIWRAKDPEFSRAWDEAKQDGIDMIAANLIKRAKEKDTPAAIFLLKSLRPEEFGEKVQPSVQVNVLTKVNRVIVRARHSDS